MLRSEENGRAEHATTLKNYFKVVLATKSRHAAKLRMGTLHKCRKSRYAAIAAEGHLAKWTGEKR